ncbi:unnamed protein product [marine sediment metagenome]|uniref:Uncharacterized protein n=1 Tax=marine sediment metagenome TaxID=412755 RepID=X1MQ06_9ZZZZ
MRITQPPVSLISGITIDGDVDWGGFSITNFKHLDLISGGYVKLEDSLAANLDWSGILFEGTAGENLAQFETVYRHSDGNYQKAKADSVLTMPVFALSVEAINEGEKGKFILFGWARKVGWGLTAGLPIYQSAGTAGAGTTTIPSGGGNQIQKIGIGLTTEIAHFMGIYTVFEVTS